MISVADAYEHIDRYVTDFGTEKIYFLQALNRVLATDIFADRDFPPFDRVTMDGIAINSAAFLAGQRKFVIEKLSAAGSIIQTLNHPDQCVEVMTGTVLPLNTDVVIAYEQCHIQDGMAEVKADEISIHQNIHRQGTDEKKGAVLLEKKTRIAPAHISVMATVGSHETEVYKLPSVAICSTGNELVTVTETPLPYQIRQSNIYFLAADLQNQNISASLHHLPDHKEKMQQQLETILQNNDVVLLSGAVSKGKWDFLPEVLQKLGMQTVFHRVAQRPGQPFLFGNIGKKLIFGFPGNPISTFVCYHLYFKHWLLKSLYQPDNKITAVLSRDLLNSSLLTQHTLVKLIFEQGVCLAEPILFSTSGDIPALLIADGILSFPPGKTVYKKGDIFEVIRCR